jgi:YceI-like domain
MQSVLTRENFDVYAKDSTLTFFAATSTTKPVYGRATGLNGYVQIAWDGTTIATDPNPKIHVEFFVEDLHSGSDLKDHEMWKMIDSKRFPKIAAELLELRPTATDGRYTASGQITFAGLARKHESDFTVVHELGRVTLDGYVKIDVREFGLKEKKMLMFSVEPVVKARLHLVAIRAS